jgi:hypothetical protein
MESISINDKTLTLLMRVRTGIRIVGLLFSFMAVSQAGDFLDQLWPQTDLYVKVKQNTRVYAFYSGTRIRDSGYSDGQAGIHLDFFTGSILNPKRTQDWPDEARRKALQFRVGYLFGRTPGDRANPFVEHAGTAEFTPRFYLAGKVLLTDRNRADFRFINGRFTPRYRNRLRCEHTFHLGRLTINPYGSVEAFQDWRFDPFYRFRYSAGAEVGVKRWLVLESYYLRQQDSKPFPNGVNVLGLVLQFYVQ